MPRLLPIVAAGWGFAIGSALFMAGVPLGLVPALPPALAGWTFFVGSLFFTTAAALQTVAAVRPDGSRLIAGKRQSSRSHPSKG